MITDIGHWPPLRVLVVTDFTGSLIIYICLLIIILSCFPFYRLHLLTLEFALEILIRHTNTTVLYIFTVPNDCLNSLLLTIVLKWLSSNLYTIMADKQHPFVGFSKRPFLSGNPHHLLNSAGIPTNVQWIQSESVVAFRSLFTVL